MIPASPGQTGLQCKEHIVRRFFGRFVPLDHVKDAVGRIEIQCEGFRFEKLAGHAPPARFPQMLRGAAFAEAVGQTSGNGRDTNIGAATMLVAS